AIARRWARLPSRARSPAGTWSRRRALEFGKQGRALRPQRAEGLEIAPAAVGGGARAERLALVENADAGDQVAETIPDLLPVLRRVAGVRHELHALDPAAVALLPSEEREL